MKTPKSHSTVTDGIVSPEHAPQQKDRILEWLLIDGGLTQIEALKELAVGRLAARISEMKKVDGHTIRTEFVDVKTRYGPATVARYHLVTLAPLDSFELPKKCQEPWRVRPYLHPVDLQRIAHRTPEQPELFRHTRHSASAPVLA